MRPIRTHSCVVRHVTAGACIVAFFLAAQSNAQPPVEPVAFGESNYLAVAWNEGGQGPGKLQLMRSSPPWQFEGPIRDVGVNATLRFANGLIYVVNPTLDTINVFDPDGLQSAIPYALAKGCQPRDIAVIDALTGELLTNEPVPTTGPPTEMALQRRRLALSHARVIWYTMQR